MQYLSLYPLFRPETYPENVHFTVQQYISHAIDLCAFSGGPMQGVTP